MARGVRCRHSSEERGRWGCRACARARVAVYRSLHPYIAGGARNPDRLMAAEKKELRALGVDPSYVRVETGRPYVLYGGSDGPEMYCPDGYLQGEPCPHSCWRKTDEGAG